MDDTREIEIERPRGSRRLYTGNEHTTDMIITGLVMFTAGFVAGIITWAAMTS